MCVAALAIICTIVYIGANRPTIKRYCLTDNCYVLTENFHKETEMNWQEALSGKHNYCNVFYALYHMCTSSLTSQLEDCGNWRKRL